MHIVNNRSIKWRLAISINLLAVLAVHCSCHAFKFLPEVHQTITRDALRDKFKLDEKRCLEHINTGLIEQDSANMMEGKVHCDDNLIEEGLESAEKTIVKAIDLSKDAYKDPAKLRETLKTFGLGLHTLQDFYAHSNYLERELQGKSAGFNVNKLQPVDWQNIKAEIRNGLQTGYYAIEETVDTSKTSVWDAITNPIGAVSNALTFDRNKVVSVCASSFKLNVSDFHSQKEFDEREKAETKKPDEHLAGALKYVNDPQKKVLHYELNKDIPSMPQGKVPFGTTNLFNLACLLSRKETEKRWQSFEDTIRSKYAQPAKYKLILPAVRGQDVPSIAMTVQANPAPDADGKLSGSIGLTLHGLIEPMNVEVSAKDVTSGGSGPSGQTQTLNDKSDGTYSIPLTQVIAIAPPKQGTQCLEIRAAFAEDNTFDVQRKWLLTQSGEALLDQLRALFPPGAKEINGKVLPVNPGGNLAVSIAQYPGIFMSTIVRTNTVEAATKLTEEASGTDKSGWKPVQGLGEGAWEKLKLKDPEDKRMLSSSQYTLEFKRGCYLFVCDVGDKYVHMKEAELTGPAKKITALLDRKMQEEMDREISTVETVLTNNFSRWATGGKLTEADVRRLIQDSSLGIGVNELSTVNFLWNLFIGHPERLIQFHGTPKDGQSVTLADLKKLIADMKTAGNPKDWASGPELPRKLREDFYYDCGLCGELTRTVPPR